MTRGHEPHSSQEEGFQQVQMPKEQVVSRGEWRPLQDNSQVIGVF